MLQVRFARPESEQARQRRIQSYEFLQKKQAEEPWVHLTYHGVKVEGVLTIGMNLSPFMSADVMRFVLVMHHHIAVCVCNIEFRAGARSMKGSTCSVSQWMPRRTLN